jgi:hypothetical protein
VKIPEYGVVAIQWFRMMHRRGISASPLLRILTLGVFLSVNIPFFLHSTFMNEGEGSLRNAFGNDLKIPIGHPDTLESSSSNSMTPTIQTETSACLYTMDDNHYLIGTFLLHS